MKIVVRTLVGSVHLFLLCVLGGSIVGHTRSSARSDNERRLYILVCSHSHSSRTSGRRGRYFPWLLKTTRSGETKKSWTKAKKGIPTSFGPCTGTPNIALGKRLPCPPSHWPAPDRILLLAERFQAHLYWSWDSPIFGVHCTYICSIE